MNIETELKLLIKTEYISELLIHPILQEYSLNAPSHQHLISYYFDTPDHLLLKHGLILRVRDIDGHYLQTIKKTVKATENGLHQRQEWEKVVDGMQPDLTAIPDSKLSALLLKKSAPQLEILFATDFYRTAWELYPTETTTIELALDIGAIKTEHNRETIQEVELELRSGDLETLQEISAQLQKDVHLIPNDVSKAERGYQLLQL